MELYQSKFSGEEMDGLFDIVKNGGNLACGTYTGNHTFGSSNPNSLTFDFVPRIIIIQCVPTEGGDGHDAILIPALQMGFSHHLSGTSKGFTLKVSVSGNTVSWYHSSYPAQQMNQDGWKYYYIAF